MNIVYYLKPLDEIEKGCDFNHGGYFDILKNFYSTLPTKVWSGRISVFIKNIQEERKYTTCIEDFEKLEKFFEVTDDSMEKAIGRAFNFFREFYTEKIEVEED